MQATWLIGRLYLYTILTLLQYFSLQCCQSLFVQIAIQDLDHAQQKFMTSKILTLTLLTEIDLIPTNSEESFQLRSQLKEGAGGSVEQRLARWICNPEVPRSNPPPYH